ncbi:MAG: hypothetical protein IPL91_14340 [Hyphomicrobium sp.]|nr:hypothetical protein [Hyphomicrobium sp.]
MASRAPQFSTDPSPEALAYFRNKGLTPSFNWQDVWAAEHANAFTVAKATELEILQTIRAAVDDALAKGQTFEDFSKALTPKLQKFGWWGRQFVTDPETGEQVFAQLGSPARLRLIFDANIRTAHAAGQWERAQRTKAVLPFFLYIETTSREPREEHLAQVGTIAHVDDAYWDTWFPPNGWNCKCSVRQITKAEAEKLGWKKGDVPPVWPTRPFVNKRTGAIEEVPEGIDPGWHTNPAKARFTMLDQMLSGKLDDIDDTIRAVALKDMTSNWLFKRMASGEFYDFAAPWKTPNIAAPVGHLSRDLQALLGRQSGVVWMTPDRPFVMKMPSIETWAKLPQVIEEGAAVRHKADANYLTFYRHIDGKTYRAEIAVRDVTPAGEKIKGGRFDLQLFHEIDAKTAKFEMQLAEMEQRVIRREAEKTVFASPAILPVIASVAGLSLPPLRPGDRQTLLLKDGSEIEIHHKKSRGNAGLRHIAIRNSAGDIGDLYYDFVRDGSTSRILVYDVQLMPEFQRRGIATMLYDRIESWATEAGFVMGPSEKLMPKGFAFWRKRAPSHPRILADARNYETALLEYGQKRHGAGVQIAVNWTGRKINFVSPSKGPREAPRILESVSYDYLAKIGIIPDIPAYKIGGAGG